MKIRTAAGARAPSNEKPHLGGTASVVLATIVVAIGAGLLLSACGEQAEKVHEGIAEMAHGKISADDAMVDLVRRWDEAERSGDPDQAVALYADEGSMALPPDMPGVFGKDALRTMFSGQQADGGIDVSNRFEETLSSGDLVLGRGTYAWNKTDASGAMTTERGKWLVATRWRDDGTLEAIGNIWNRDAPPPGAPAPDPVNATGPAAPADGPCAGSPKEIHQLFVSNFNAGNIAALVSLHAENGLRMPPGMPAMVGRADIGAFMQSRADMFSEQQLEISDVAEVVEGEIGYLHGRFSVSQKPLGGGDPVTSVGKFMGISQKREDGCWRFEWLMWNRDTHWPTGS